LAFIPDFDLEGYAASYHNYRSPEESKASIKLKVLVRLREMGK